MPLFSRVEVDTHTHTRTHTVYGQCLHGPLYLQLLSLTCLVTNLGCLSCAGFHVLVFIWSPNTLTQRACSHEAGGVPGRKRTRFQCVCVYVCMYACMYVHLSPIRISDTKLERLINDLVGYFHFVNLTPHRVNLTSTLVQVQVKC